MSEETPNYEFSFKYFIFRDFSFGEFRFTRSFGSKSAIWFGWTCGAGRRVGHVGSGRLLQQKLRAITDGSHCAADE